MNIRRSEEIAGPKYIEFHFPENRNVIDIREIGTGPTITNYWIFVANGNWYLEGTSRDDITLKRVQSSTPSKKDDDLQIDWSHPFGKKKVHQRDITLPMGQIPAMEEWLKRIEGEQQLASSSPKACTCGSSSVGSPFHSDWCDLYQPESK